MNVFTKNWRRAVQTTAKVTVSIVLTALLTSALAVSAFEQVRTNSHSSGASGLTTDVRSYLRNPLAYFAQRSPGARGPGELIQSKHRAFRLSGRRVKPHEQVLAKIRYPSPLPAYINDLVAPASPGLLETSGPLIANGQAGAAASSEIASSSVPANFSGAGAGGPGGNASANNGSTVPEPATWFMLILGMALVGFAMRRSAHGSVAYA